MIDALGRQTSHFNDYANQPTAISGTNRNGQSVNASYVYDGHHRRVKQTVNGTTIYSVYGSQGQLLHRLNATTNTATDYIAIANTTVAEVERVGSNDTVRYPYFDHLGSAVKMGNASGGLISSEQAIFLPFGERWGTTNQAANGRGFTGHVDDTELGLTYMQARYYDPVIGRFYSNDPVGTLGHFQNGNIQGFNRHAYANNNPYKYTDPDGMDPFLVGRPLKQPLGNFAGHMFIVTGAKFVGDTGPNVKFYPYGQNSDGNLGLLSSSNEGDLSKGTTVTDKAFSGGLSRDSNSASLINASDDVVDSIADSLVADQPYDLPNVSLEDSGTIAIGIPVRPVTPPSVTMTGVNSNSAAQAVANRAAGQTVAQPKSPGAFGYPGAENANKIHFNEQ
ncbi:RHS repeat-associated core domain-containing protein [Umboniibacter marinipuniceus]|uniref:RHS repeat-associated protein n=1 Tax=Umboniibacter marinipuniceus TaxID=569599 RepID=A0A3M0ADG0_9GAMM|nr:RHS repeat-associated core domain-containing protein [Umboniibacter marinipuniceus]RMA82154.1 RHS repeat-associated protein [Umboniibacter marinipuniceus]